MSLSFAPAKRRLLAWLALLAPVPLPFNELLPWPALGLYALVVVGFLLRLRRDARTLAPAWAANLLGLAYLPLLWLDLVAFSGGRVVGPLVRLLLFALALKLYRLSGEGDKWQAFAGCFIVFLAAMGTSVHPSIIVYLVAFQALALLVLARFVHFGVLADLGHRERDPSPVPLPLRGAVAAMTLLVVLVAVPLFAILPRARAPFIAGRGSPASANVVSVANFSDEVTLDSIGSQRGNRGVALRLSYVPALDERRDEVRIKAGAFDRFDGRTWHRPDAASDPPFQRSFDGRYRVLAGPDGRAAGTRTVTVWRQVIDSAALPLPVEALRFRVNVLPGLQFDAGGVARLAGRPRDALVYDVELGERATSAALPPNRNSDLTSVEGLAPEITALASRVAGEGASPGEVLARLERHLLENYEYSLEFLAQPAERPVEEFLLRTRRGQCEYFATSLVLMLRARGVPARLVTGFLGGELNPIDGHLVVRQDNAHAWVEAWIDGQGWTIADPTPPAGRPAFGSPGLGRIVGQLWDFVVFRWDRYVLTYGAADQRDFLLRVFDGAWRWWQRVRGGRGPVPETPAPQIAEESVPSPSPVPPGPSATAVLGAAAVVVGALAGIAWWLGRRTSAERAYRQLRAAASEFLRPPQRALGPLALLDQIGALAPTATAPSRSIVDAYLRESFAGQAPVGRLDRDLRSVLRELRRLAHARGRRG